MEKRGIPVASETFDLDDLVTLAERTFMKRGVPKVRQVLTTPDTSLKSLKEFVPALIDALTRPLTDEERWSGTKTPPKQPRIAFTGTYDEVQAFFQGELHRFKGRRPPLALMTDGLPVTPPTEERVAAMLKGTSHAPDEVVKPKIKPDQFFVPQEELIGATVEKIAINAVMAGCRPEQMPVILAMAELGANVGCPCDCDFSHMFAVSGPIAREIGMNDRFHALSPGNPPNISMGRAATLIGINLGGVIFGANVIERIGAFIWGLTFAEAPTGTGMWDSPWEGLNVTEGYGTNESVLVGFGGPVKVNGACLNEAIEATNLSELQYGSPEMLVAAFKASRETRSALVILTPDAARQWQKEFGFKNKQELQDYLYDNATRTRGEWGKQYFFYMTSQRAKSNPRGSRMINPDHLELPDDALVPIIVNGAREIKVIITGGAGFQWGYGNAWGTSSTLIDRWR